MGNKSYSKGISWINDCRIPFEGEGDKQKRLNEENSRKSDKIREGFSKTKVIPNLEQQGRFPANILVSDDMLNDSGSSSRYYDIDKWFNNLIDV